MAVDKIVLDTGNSWFALETRDCQDCLPGKYDYTLNPNTYSQLPSSQAQLYVGDGLLVSGAQSVDWVCLSEDTDTCVPNFPFFSLHEIGLSDEVNGVLGLNANSADVLNNPRAPNFVDFLYDQGTIAARVFSVSMWSHPSLSLGFMTNLKHLCGSMCTTLTPTTNFGGKTPSKASDSDRLRNLTLPNQAKNSQYLKR